MIEIQKIAISNVASETLKVEITIADNPDTKEASVWLVARLPVQREGLSLENVASATLDAVRKLIEQAADPIERKILEQP